MQSPPHNDFPAGRAPDPRTTCIREGDVLTITIPCTVTRRHLKPPWKLVRDYFIGRRPRDLLWWLFEYRPSEEPMIIQITPTHLIMHHVWPKKCTTTHPREQVYDVHYTEHSNQVFIHTHGMEMLELYFVSDPPTLRWFVNTLCAELKLGNPPTPA